jgi:hypothetical protein
MVNSSCIAVVDSPGGYRFGRNYEPGVKHRGDKSGVP